MPKLYELTDQFKQFSDFVENALDNDENLTEDDLQLYINILDSYQGEVENKVENIVKFLKNIEGDIKAYEAEEKRLEKKKKYLKSKYDGIKKYTQEMLEIAGIEKVKAGTFNIRLQKNPPSVNILNESKVPTIYRIPQPDKIMTKEILEAIKSGEVIEGVELVDNKKHIRFS